jgi:single-strand DNA-binding protein
LEKEKQMNRVSLLGNLTRDPELKELKTGNKVVKFSVAVNGRPYKKNGETVRDVTYLECEAWEGGAEMINKHFQKGKGIIVHGELRQDRWETEDGQKRNRHFLRVIDFDFVPGSKRDEQDGGEERQAAKASTSSKKATKPAPQQDDQGGDGDIPF